MRRRWERRMERRVERDAADDRMRGSLLEPGLAAESFLRGVKCAAAHARKR